MWSLARACVLVTGAGSGIGRSLAGAFAARGAVVAVTDRDLAAAEQVAAAIRRGGGTARAFAMDVTDPEAVARARDAVLATLGPVDVLVNNAGIVFGGAFTAVSLDRHLETCRINLGGLVTVTHAFLPVLQARPRARVVNIASAAAFVGLPNGSTYAASKWAVVGFSDSIRLELQELGLGHVGVTTVCPSFVSTGLFDGASPPRLTPPLTPDRVAARVVRAVERGRDAVLMPWMVTLTPRLRGLLPRRVFDRVAGWFGVTTSMRAWRGRGSADLTPAPPPPRSPAA